MDCKCSLGIQTLQCQYSHYTTRHPHSTLCLNFPKFIPERSDLNNLRTYLLPNPCISHRIKEVSLNFCPCLHWKTKLPPATSKITYVDELIT